MKVNVRYATLALAVGLVWTVYVMRLAGGSYNTTYKGSSVVLPGLAVSGRRFSGEKQRNYTGPILLAAPDALVRYPSPASVDTSRKKWAVCTTIFEPSEAILRFIAQEHWSVVVVGDVAAAPFSINASNIVYLGVEAQTQLAAQHRDLVSLLPWRHFGRKNIGYLYAISSGAEIIWDFDDDNVMKSGKEPAFPNTDIKHVKVPADCLAFNPYPAMGDPSTVPNVPPSWPRGFPLEHIRQPCRYSLLPGGADKVAIVQSLADNDPDVDGVFRLTRGVPFAFDARVRHTLVLPSNVLAPFNAQATLVKQPAFWSLLLPVTVHGRVSDIWRSYVAQRLLWDIGMQVAFSPPMVNQFRTPHDYLADMQAEEALYYKSGRLVAFLNSWQGRTATLPARLEELMVELFERDYVGIQDVQLVQQWVISLAKLGYKFPEVTGMTSQTRNAHTGPHGFQPPVDPSQEGAFIVQPDALNGLGTNLTWSNLASMAIVCKTYSAAAHTELIPELIMSFMLFWPKDYGELVLVLDNEVESEHFAGALLEQLSPQIHVVYENLTVNPSTIFLGKDYEKRYGYDRQMMMRMFADLYTSAEYIAVMDADASFITAVTPSNLFASDGRPLMGAVYTHKDYYKKNTEAALGVPDSGIDFMTRFPLIFKRQHFQSCREHIVKTLKVGSFADAWHTLLQIGTPSEQTLLGNCVWHFHRHEYAWHIQIDPRNDPSRPMPVWTKDHPEYLTPMHHLAGHKLFESGFPGLFQSMEVRQGYCLAATSVGVDKPFCAHLANSTFTALTRFQGEGKDFSAPFTTAVVDVKYLTHQQARFIQASEFALRKMPGPEVVINMPPL